MKKIYLPILLFLSLLYMPFSSTLAHGGQVTYCAHIAYDGWLGWVYDGQTAGSPGSGKEMQAVKIKVTGFPPTYHIYYQAHVAYDGWLSWVSDGEVAGTTEEAKQMEAIKIKLQGFPSNYHVTYRAYVQNSGWQSWVSDGAVAGTTDQSKAMEAFEIKIYEVNPTIAQSPMSGPPGTTFTEWGTGFTPNSTATLHFKMVGGSELPTRSEQIDSDGTFHIFYDVPADYAPGDYEWWAVDGPTGEKSNTVTYTVTRSVNPVVAMTPQQAVAGEDRFEEWGTGFTPNSTATLHFKMVGGSELPTRSEQIDSDGTFHIFYDVPADYAPGDYEWWAVDGPTGEKSNTVTYTVTRSVNPVVAMTPQQAVAGEDRFEEWGTGFTPNSTATLHFKMVGGSELPTRSEQIDSDGTFHIFYDVPADYAPGDYEWWAVDGPTGEKSNTVTYTVTRSVNPVVAMTPQQAVAGEDRFEEWGTGFTPNSTATLHFKMVGGSELPTRSEQIDSDGTFHIFYDVPADYAPGDYEWWAVDGPTGEKSNTVTYTVTRSVNPVVAMTPQQAVAGEDRFEEWGTGFTPNSTATLHFKMVGGSELPTRSEQIDSDGTFHIFYDVPADYAPGDYEWWAVDGPTGEKSNTVTYTVTRSVNPVVAMTPQQAVAGEDRFEEWGTGFTPNSTATLHFKMVGGSELPTRSEQIDSDGTFHIFYDVPADYAPGDYEWWAVDGPTGEKSNTVTYTVTRSVNPVVAMTPQQAVAGEDRFEEWGTGFTPNSTATLHFKMVGGSELPTRSEQIDSDGTFHIFYDVPADYAPGDYEWWAVDGPTGEKSNTVTYTVTRSVNPVVAMTPQQAVAGEDRFEEWGTGFTPNSTATLHFKMVGGSELPTRSEQIDSDGTFHIFYDVPADYAPGDYEWWAVDGPTGEKSNTVTYTVTRSVNPVVAMTPQQAVAGEDRFEEWGTGFTPNSTATLHFKMVGGSELPTRSEQIDSDGTFHIFYDVPADYAPGDYEWWAVDGPTGEKSNTVTYTVTRSVNPVVAMTPQQAVAGEDRFEEWGTGFTPNSTATLHFKMVGGSELPTRSEQIDSDGTFHIFYDVPADYAPGDYEWWAVDGPTGEKSNTVTYTVTRSVNPVVNIIFVSNYDGDEDIYLLDGGEIEPITENNWNDGCPRVSPDGQQIVFSSNRTGNWDIWLMNSDGSDQINLTENHADDGWPSWAPDGSKIVFSSDRSTGKLQIHIMDINTREVWRLTSEHSVENHAVWSPDGKEIAFASNRDDGYWNIYIMNADGSGSPQNITNNSFYNDYPAWSPDGKEIAFASSRNSSDNDKLDLYITNSDGSNCTPLYIMDGDERYPSWSPDGMQILFAHGESYKKMNYDIYTIDPDGATPPVRLTFYSAENKYCNHPDWILQSDTGKELAIYWSPVIYQQTDTTGGNGLGGRADYITSFDFDDDLKGDNNWENAEIYPLRAYVYYDIKETETHWFIYYAIYHPRDWEDRLMQYFSDIPLIGTPQHENDMEAMLMVVRKDGSQHGSLEIIESMGHNVWFNYPDPLNLGIQIDLKNTNFSSDMSDGVNFETTSSPHGIHPIGYIQARGHAIFFDENQNILATLGNLSTGINDWDEEGFNGVVYRYKGIPEEPEYQNDNDVGYQLLELEELWDMRNNSETFVLDEYGLQAFKGTSPSSDTADDNKAHPPWAILDYYNSYDHPLSTHLHGLEVTSPGTFFHDPAGAILVRYAMSNLSIDYTNINLPPTADAGPDQTVDEGVIVTLDGFNSCDLDDGIASYQWSQTSGSSVTLSDPNAVQPTFTAPIVGPDGASLSFELTVIDNGGRQSTDTCIVKVMFDPDKDNDSLPDDWELTYFGDLSKDGTADSDSDGLPDKDEYENGTDPTNYDTDADDLPDGWEADNGLDPLDATENNGRDGDFDGDGYTNIQEYLSGTEPNDENSIPFEIKEVLPHDNAGIDPDDTRVPNNTSFAVRIHATAGIDITNPNSIRFTINDGVNVERHLYDTQDDTQGVWLRVTQVHPDEPETAVTQLWAVYHRAAEDDERENIYPYNRQISITVNAEDNTGLPMVEQSYAFKIETDAEHADAEANLPETVPVDPTDPDLADPEYAYDAGIEVTSGDLEGARIIYDSNEAVKPTLGPTNELPPFEAGVDAVGLPMNLQPPTVFMTPVKIFIPCPGQPDVSALSVYLYNETDWVLACDATGNVQPGGEGWMVPGSRVNHPDTEPPTIEIKVYHFTGVQAGISASGDDGTGSGGGGGGGCFVATAAFGSPMETHVAILKNFRDTYLLPCSLGRIFVRTYNKYSPPLAHFIAEHEMLKVAVRISLMPLVAVSYSILHLGPIITLTMLVVLLATPLFLVSFYRREASSYRANNSPGT